MLVTPVQKIEAYTRHHGNSQQGRDLAQNMQIPEKRFYTLSNKFNEIYLNELKKHQA